ERTDGGSRSSAFGSRRPCGGGFARALTRRIRLPVGSRNPSRPSTRSVAGVALHTLTASCSDHAAGKARRQNTRTPFGGAVFIFCHFCCHFLTAHARHYRFLANIRLVRDRETH